MRKSPVVAVAAAAATVLITGCGSGGAPAATPAGSGTAPAATASQTPASSAPASSTPAAPTPPTWPDTPRTSASNGPAGQLTDIAVGRHVTFDRIVFHFSGAIPGYDVRYVKQVLADGSGQPVTLQGQAFLHIVFNPVTPQQAYTGPDTLTPGYPVLRQVRSAGGFEGYLTFGAGLTTRVGFNVFTLTNPGRIVIDVAHSS